LVEDYVFVVAVGVATASVVVMVTSLLRYRELVKDARRSTALAKDVWDSVSARFSVLDSRVIDLMARTELLSSRVISSRTTPQKDSFQGRAVAEKPSVLAMRDEVRMVTGSAESTETEERVLRFLAQGPRTSAQIKEEVGRSREHTARLMKALFDRRLVTRDDRTRPYVYEITETGRSHVGS